MKSRDEWERIIWSSYNEALDQHVHSIEAFGAFVKLLELLSALFGNKEFYNL
jgi:hypothetical protein